MKFSENNFLKHILVKNVKLYNISVNKLYMDDTCRFIIREYCEFWQRNQKRSKKQKLQFP